VGKATAYDEFVEFELKNNKVYVNVFIYYENRVNMLKKHLIAIMDSSMLYLKKERKITQKLMV
jgi:hypothetical protein